MARTIAEPGVWTDITAFADGTILEARGIGFYVDTTGNKPANPTEGYALASGEAMVIASQDIAIQPAQPVKSVLAISNPA